MDADVSDVELWLACRDGSAAAFTTVYRRHAKAVLRYAWAITGGRDAAEEALQETFTTAWEKRRYGHAVNDSVLPWLLVICKNKSRNILRRIHKHGSESWSLPALEGMPAVDDESHPALWILDELGRLSAQDQEICQLCLVEGRSYAEAARLLRITDAAVGKRLQRARNRLQQALSVESRITK